MNTVQSLAATAALALCATPTLAQTPHPISSEIATQGLAAVEQRLSTLDAPTPEEAFALGAVRFLGGIERGLATRWEKNIGADVSSLPMLRVPLPTNAEAEAFAPGDIAALFEGLAADMEAARAPLEGMSDPVGLTLDLADLWFDIDGDGTRHPTETIASFLPQGQETSLVVRFDTADRDWLIAYTHLLSATADLVLAFDPTDAIAEVVADSAALQAFEVRPEDRWSEEFRPALDYIAIVRDTLDQQPDPERIARARTHMMEMIARNRAFWAAVDAETDDAAEWIPSATQTSALGLAVAPEAGARWQSVLDELEAILEGQKLIRHPLVPGAGINIAAYAADPRPVDIVAWLHGRGALPYLEAGEMASDGAWRRFTEVVGHRNGLLFAVLFN
ncbi:MAG: hypothetical protein AAF913_15595 [Pseudomonadota bacterium]